MHKYFQIQAILCTEAWDPKSTSCLLEFKGVRAKNIVASKLNYINHQEGRNNKAPLKGEGSLKSLVLHPINSKDG